ncbi:NAC domain-containing protein 62-like [Punica granatum]|uniref:NAC domain-containing protein 62-like n=2 Tax=Punica granatum TaxID=22663 RepID=A0A6P8CKR9_PUNGR|nr:NAC domain-containing protein 62-like [Punica granatum]PKI65701.1 hypothetical protein CRG98_013890 [Punica granatum]
MEMPPILGLNFSPTGSELLIYLKQRILDYFEDPNYSRSRHLIPDIELPDWDPKELPHQYNRLSAVRSNGRQWFFFCFRKERTVANVGYWKITSSDKKVKCEDTREELGRKKTLTFYRGRVPNGKLTNWGMHEYHLNQSYLGYNIDEMPFVVCCVFKRSGNIDYDNDDKSTFHEEVLSNNAATPESPSPTNRSASTVSEEVWQSLPDIQELPSDSYAIGGDLVEEPIIYDSYADAAGPSLEGLFDGNSSNNYSASTLETDDYNQQYQGGWNSFY